MSFGGNGRILKEPLFLSCSPRAPSYYFSLALLELLTISLSMCVRKSRESFLSQHSRRMGLTKIKVRRREDSRYIFSTAKMQQN